MDSPTTLAALDTQVTGQTQKTKNMKNKEPTKYDSGKIVKGAGTAYPSGAPKFTPGIQQGFVLLDLQIYEYVLQIIVCPFDGFFFGVM